VSLGWWGFGLAGFFFGGGRVVGVLFLGGGWVLWCGGGGGGGVFGLPTRGLVFFWRVFVSHSDSGHGRSSHFGLCVFFFFFLVPTPRAVFFPGPCSPFSACGEEEF